MGISFFFFFAISRHLVFFDSFFLLPCCLLCPTPQFIQYSWRSFYLFPLLFSLRERAGERRGDKGSFFFGVYFKLIILLFCDSVKYIKKITINFHWKIFYFPSYLKSCLSYNSHLTASPPLSPPQNFIVVAVVVVAAITTVKAMKETEEKQ